MRIVGGKYKGKRLFAPKNLPTRPTTDFAKEGLFNILENRRSLEGIEVLDLFSGTGNISYEFASRGAKTIIGIEQNYRAVRYIKEMAKELDAPISIFKTDVFRGILKVKQQFDIIFADPPYQLKEIPKIISLVFDNELLKKDGILIVEHDRAHNFESHPNFTEHRKFGNVNFSIFSYE